jgi:uncharacterized membrane protein YbhN (UPF0104 family)
MPLLFLPSEPPVARRRKLWIVLGVTAAMAVGWLLAHLDTHTFDWRLALTSLAHLHWGWLGLSVLLIGATYMGRALRWAVFL